MCFVIQQINGRLFCQVSYCDHPVSCICQSTIKIFFKQHLLLHGLMNIDRTSQECSMGSPILKLFQSFGFLGQRRNIMFSNWKLEKSSCVKSPGPELWNFSETTGLEPRYLCEALPSRPLPELYVMSFGSLLTLPRWSFLFT